MEGKINNIERGQSLVLIGLLMIAFVAMLALVVDGGFSYANRRAAQNAADAGALAGADALCAGGGTEAAKAQAEAQAISYAVDNNHATSAEADAHDIDIDVTAHVSYQTFFASILGFDVVTATAEATAGCFEGCRDTGVLPVAWSCKPPATITETETLTDCVVNYGTYISGTLTPGEIYVIMDSSKTCFLENGVYVDDRGRTCDPTRSDIQCQDPPNSGEPEFALDCDFDDVPNANGDFENDLLGAGQRAWINLDGGSGNADELGDWIENGFGGNLDIHTWIAGSSGVKGTVFSDAADFIVGDIVYLPVFDQLCTSGEPDETCPALWHEDSDPPDSIIPGVGQMYYHIIRFSAFYVTCVDYPPHTEPDPPPGGGRFCPGKQAFITENDDPDDRTDDNDYDNVPTIEGYFIKNYDPGLSGTCKPGLGSGAYTIYLTP